MKALKSILGNLGFKALKTGLYASRFEDFVHIFALTKSRSDKATTSIYSGVWRPGWSGKSTAESVDQLRTPVFGGDIGPAGLLPSKWWDTELMDVSLLERSILKIAVPSLVALSNRKVLQEVISESLVGEKARSKIDEELKKTLSPLNVPFDLARSSYPELVPHVEVQSKEEFRAVVLARLRGPLGEAGFQVVLNEKQIVFIRKRKEIVDVLEPFRGRYGLFFELRFYSWSDSIWKTRNELKGMYIQTNGGQLTDSGEGLSAIVSCEIKTQPGLRKISGMITEQALPFFNSIQSENQLYSIMDESWRAVLRK